MNNRNLEEKNTFKELNNFNARELIEKINSLQKKMYYFIFIFIFFSMVHIITLKKNQFTDKKNVKPVEKEPIKNEHIFAKKDPDSYDYIQDVFNKEQHRKYLDVLNKKRTFEHRYPLDKEIKCIPHFKKNELIAFLSFLTNNTIFFETGSGCSSIIAKHYAKKSIAIEGGKDWYEMGIKNGLKENLIFHDLKPDNPIWSKPGKQSTIEDWKKYFQSYKKEYNADVILIDGRFKIATAMDIFNKINDDTIVLIHEYPQRPIYFILDEYYQYIYHWDSLTAFVKKKDIKSIPLEIQKQYWDKYS